MITATFKNDDGTVLQTVEVESGAVPEYTGETPTKDATAQYTYTFSGWSPEVGAITEDTIYTATYTSVVNSYVITWKDGDEETLKTDTLEYGATPSYDGETPTKTRTAQYTYTFNGNWSPEIATVTEAATYTAQFDSTVNEYTVTFKDNTGEILQETEEEYGTTPAYAGEVPYHEGCSFAWSPEIATVTEDAVYTATYPLEAFVVNDDQSGGSDCRRAVFQLADSGSVSYIPDWADVGSVAYLADMTAFWVKDNDGDWVESTSDALTLAWMI